MNNERYIFDVGLISLATAQTPVSSPAFEYLEDAILGNIDVVIPNTAIIGAHHVLRDVYHIRRQVATKLLDNILDSSEIEFYHGVSKERTRSSLECAGNHNIDAWDGFLTKVAEETNADKIVTTDDDFQSVESVECELVLTKEEQERLNGYIGQLNEIRGFEDL